MMNADIEQSPFLRYRGLVLHHDVSLGDWAKLLNHLKTVCETMRASHKATGQFNLQDLAGVTRAFRLAEHEAPELLEALRVEGERKRVP